MVLEWVYSVRPEVQKGTLVYETDYLKWRGNKCQLLD